MSPHANRPRAYLRDNPTPMLKQTRRSHLTLAALALITTSLLLCLLTALPAQGAASLSGLAQPSPRPPLAGTATSDAATAAALTAAAQLPPAQSTGAAPTDAGPTFVLPTTTLVRTRAPNTPTATPTATASATATHTSIPTSVFATATSQAETAQAATVEVIVAMTAAALQPATATSAPPTTPAPTEVITVPLPQILAETAAPAARPLGALLWIVLAIPLVMLAISLLWLGRGEYALLARRPRSAGRWRTLRRSRSRRQPQDVPY